MIRYAVPENRRESGRTQSKLLNVIKLMEVGLWRILPLELNAYGRRVSEADIQIALFWVYF